MTRRRRSDVFALGAIAAGVVAVAPACPAPPVPDCLPEALSAPDDVDGDGRTDAVAHDFDSQQLHVCLASGRREVLPQRGGDLVYTADADDDGASEVFVGGTSVSASFVRIATWHDDDLVEVVTADDEPLLLTRGGLDRDDATSSWKEFRDWTCRDDADADIVSAIAIATADGYVVGETTYALKDGRAEVVAENHYDIDQIDPRGFLAGGCRE